MRDMHSSIPTRSGPRGRPLRHRSLSAPPNPTRIRVGTSAGLREMSKTSALSRPSTEPVNHLVPFRSPVLLVRWVTTALCLVQSRAAIAADPDGAVTWGCICIVVLTIARTVRPLRDQGERRDSISLLAELAVVVGLVVITGSWNSTLLFALAGTLSVVGFSRGLVGAAQYGAAASAVVMAAHLITQPSLIAEPTPVLYWLCILLLTAGVSAYARSISTDARGGTTSAEVTQLTDANALLSRLHGVASTLPASLDLDEVLDSAVQRLRYLVNTDGIAVLTADPGDDGWTVQRRKGIAVTTRVAHGDLPQPARSALATATAVLCADLSESGPGFNPGSESAIYAPLMARGNLAGLLTLERSSGEEFSELEAEVVTAYAEQMGLAIDNARLFGQLHSVSAEAERTRIARDIHDRVGQALAYLAFELDGVIRKNNNDIDISESLVGLRHDLRGVVTEVRETLYDLRTDVDDDKGLASTVEEFAERLAKRAGISITLDLDNDHRLPVLQEREVWRIAQEALTNIERHAEATHVRVTWRCQPPHAELTITDDGKGMASDRPERTDSFGILGMRERAGAIGANLDFKSQQGQGTTVTCSLNHKN